MGAHNGLLEFFTGSMEARAHVTIPILTHRVLVDKAVT
jgi:hypothetical protein